MTITLKTLTNLLSNITTKGDILFSDSIYQIGEKITKIAYERVLQEDFYLTCASLKALKKWLKTFNPDTSIDISLIASGNGIEFKVEKSSLVLFFEKTKLNQYQIDIKNNSSIINTYASILEQVAVKSSIYKSIIENLQAENKEKEVSFNNLFFRLQSILKEYDILYAEKEKINADKIELENFIRKLSNEYKAEIADLMQARDEIFTEKQMYKAESEKLKATLVQINELKEEIRELKKLKSENTYKDYQFVALKNSLLIAQNTPVLPGKEKDNINSNKPDDIGFKLKYMGFKAIEKSLGFIANRI